MKLKCFDYGLPEELIAHDIGSERDKSRMMVVRRTQKEWKDEYFYDLSKYLRKGDVLVFNQSKVIPARLFGRKRTGGLVEVLLVKQKTDSIWEAISKPGLKEGVRVFFEDSLEGQVVELADDGVFCLKFDLGGEELFNKLFLIGKTPLPPYINYKGSEDELRWKYQNIYAKDHGSVAAPTAGFHFTNRLMDSIASMGVGTEYVTLHVSLGTFRSVKAIEIEDHVMHSEWFSISEETAKRLNRVKSKGGRVIAVGTTAARVLESVCSQGKVRGKSGETDIFIYPPYRFKFVDGLITNFHLPKSTLLMLVSAFVSKPNTDEGFVDFKTSLLGKVYDQAIKKKYRFFSFGDGMLVV